MSEADTEGRCSALETRLGAKLAAHLTRLREYSRECWVVMASPTGDVALVLLFPNADSVEAEPDDDGTWELVQEPTVLRLIASQLPDLPAPPKLELVKNAHAPRV